MIKVAVAGVCGRMGALIALKILDAPELELVAAIDRSDNKEIGRTVPCTTVVVNDKFPECKIDVLIDFTSPEGVLEHLKYCVQHKIAIVIGATGFTDVQIAEIDAAAKHIPVMRSANYSIGVNLCYKLIAMAARQLDADWRVSIYDVHHEHKKDAPSGTAKSMAQIVADAGNVRYDEIAIRSDRLGETVGIHIVNFEHPQESVSIQHNAGDREIFASGAIKAAQWLFGKAAGAYTMQDVVA